MDVNFDPKKLLNIATMIAAGKTSVTTCPIGRLHCYTMCGNFNNLINRY